MAMVRVRKDFSTKVATDGISFLTLSKCGIISNFGVNLFRMSASSELEPHPSCPQARCGQLTARPASEFWRTGADRSAIRGSLLEVRADWIGLGGFTTG